MHYNLSHHKFHFSHRQLYLTVTTRYIGHHTLHLTVIVNYSSLLLYIIPSVIVSSISFIVLVTSHCRYKLYYSSYVISHSHRQLQLIVIIHYTLSHHKFHLVHRQLYLTVIISYTSHHSLYVTVIVSYSSLSLYIITSVIISFIPVIVSYISPSLHIILVIIRYMSQSSLIIAHCYYTLYPQSS